MKQFRSLTLAIALPVSAVELCACHGASKADRAAYDQLLNYCGGHPIAIRGDDDWTIDWKGRIAACDYIIRSRDSTAEQVVTVLTADSGNHVAIGHPQIALHELTNAIEIDPDNASALVARCNILNTLHLWDDANHDCTRAIQLFPEFDAALGSRGFAYAGNGDYPRAIQDYDQAIRIRPTKEYIKNRGEAYLAVGDRRRAKIDLEMAKKLPPDPIL
jgi:tetratricopeptide (TPR) repeat protein